MNVRSILFLYGAIFCMAVSVRAQTPFFTVSQDDFYQSVTNASVFERPLIDNVVRKTGAGTLTLQNPRMTRAELVVLEGGVAVSLTNAFVPSALPAALRQKAAFWVDANTNVVADGGGIVSRWHDAREASVDGPYSYMMATNAETARQPAVVADAGLGGQKYLDFGSWGANHLTNENSRWLFWAGTNGVAKTLDLRAVFIVFGSHNGSAGGRITLIQNAARLPTPSAPFAGGLASLWLSPDNNSNVTADDGINYLDRQMRDGRNIQIFDKAYHLIETFTLQTAKASNFANDRSYPGYSGGSRICEGLFFTAELTEAERLQVQDYLWHKWFSRSGESSLGALRLANASTLDLALGTNDAQVAVSGDGVISKSGTGTLVLKNGGTDTFDGTVRLQEGNLVVAGEPFLFALAEGGQTINSQGLSVNRTMGGSAGEVLKTGSNALAVASVADAVTKIAVAEGTLRLATPRVAAAVPVSNAAVNEPSLEAFTNGTTAAYVNFTANASQPPFTTNGWTFNRSAYSSGNFLVGVAFDYPRSGQVITTDLAPDGHAVLYINRGRVETSFSVPGAGFYRLSFEAAARAGNLNRHVEIRLDGVTIRKVITLSTEFWKQVIRLPYLTAGTHTIGFEGVGLTSTDFARVAFVDDIRISSERPCEEAPVLATVTNASFEGPVELFEAAVVTNEPAGTGWTFGGLAGIGRIQSLNNARSMPQRMPEGIAAAVLPVTGSVRQVVTFPTSGVYRLSFAAAARVGLVNHTFNVLFDGKLVRPFQTTDTALRRYELTLPPVATDAELEVAFVGTGATNQASLIDDVLIERIGADESVDALQNGGFEQVTTINPLVTTNWACSSLAGVYSNVNAWGETVPYGNYLGYMSMTHSFSQAVIFAESGAYALRFLTKTRSSYPVQQFHDFEVLFGGQSLGSVFNVGGDMRRYELPLPPVEAGLPYVLKFQGLQSYSVPSVSMFDQIELVPAHPPRPRKALAGRFPETTALDIAAGAALALDFEGQITVKDVRYAGHVVAGVIDATTHPEFVSGTGSILSPAKGTLFSVH